MNKTVLTETKEAYVDSDPKLDWSVASARRNLEFRASEKVSVDEAVNIMTKALRLKSPNIEGYNAFRPESLKKLPLGSEVTLAREGSVCVYVTLPEGVDVNLRQLATAMDADECDREGSQIRIWWD